MAALCTTCTTCILVLAAGLSGCSERGKSTVDSASGVRQTGFPGQVTAGGGSSGDVLAKTATPTTDATYAGGTPGIAGGSGGTTGGAATGGTVTESGRGPSSGVTAPGAAPQATPRQVSGSGEGPSGTPAPAPNSESKGTVNK